MRNIHAMAVWTLALIFVAACAPIPDLGETGSASTALQPTAALASDTPTPPAASEPPTPAAAGEPADSESPAAPGENVAVWGFANASAWSESAYLAFDGDLETMWSSGAPPMQWLAINLDDSYLVDRIELVVAQHPPGPTTHDVWLGDGSGLRSRYKNFVNADTEDGGVLDVVIDPPRNINEVVVRTIDSPSWVAWREVRVFGSQSVAPTDAGEAPRWKLKRVAVGLDLPVQAAHAGDGSGRLFVLEQKGRIRIVKDGVINADAFLDISERVSCCGERGLISIAFPPDYAGKQHFYVSYTDVDGHLIISRFRTIADPDRADPDSEEIVLAIEQPYASHNGGRIVFGPKDGYLYIGSGDGGDYSDPHNNGQNPNSMLGKILRIDVESGVQPYSIPASNPFVGVEGHRDEVWALGLRNPWGFAFDRLTGDLYIPDVGHSTHEEVNFQPAGSRGGENYGWRVTEGSICHLFPQPCSAKGMTPPAAEYHHIDGCAVVGGVVYRGSEFPSLQGHFIFADFCSGRIWGLHRPDMELSSGSRSADEDFPDGWQGSLLLPPSVPLSSIGEDEEGNVYFTGYQPGSVFMLTER